ncbi:ABC transporter substrate-binding protein [Halobacteria archaeon AArc-m2/3/4]|uniref:ABC transporter substrate-binding protein n=1 Tax=Natronoglomus mannanivorans TaxID=2979990 RepID=A0AAP3E2W3_9EURY|nr:ABC transporter substrate-binding protein [Halobacteria archaeon AArc-xg1-1]MCU4973515.1 ABC transporter substrate-binding protein [Halobacteria archaeon AArc-m2/3/4]
MGDDNGNGDGNGGNGNGNGGNGNGNGSTDEQVDATFTSYIGDPPSDFDWGILGFRDSWPRSMYGYCLDMLAFHNSEGELEPQVAVDWGWDANEFWVELRDDAYWSDGEQITAADVFMRYEHDLYLRPESPEQIAEQGGPESVFQAVTDVEFEGQTGRLISEEGWFDDFYMEQYAESFLTHPTQGEVYADSRIYEPALERMRDEVDDPWSEEGAETAQEISDELVDERDIPDPTEIRVSGAWQVAEVREDSILLEPNEHHFHADNLNFDQVELLVQTSQDATWASLQSDNLDNDPGLQVTGQTPPENIITQFPDNVQAHALDDLAFEETILVPQGNHPLLGRINVRRALLHALDTELISQNQHGFASSPLTDPVGAHAVDAGQWIDDDLYDSMFMYDHDEEQAVEYLEEEGFTREDGEWYDPDGNRFGFQLLTDSDTPTVERTVESQLSDFGIEVELLSEEDAIVQERKDTGDFEVVVETWVGYVQGKWFRGLQQSARRRMWGLFDEDQVHNWIDEHDNITNEEYDWTNNIEGFRREQTEVFTKEAPPIGEPDGEMQEYPVVSLDLEWEENVDIDRREEIMQSLIWVYNYNLTMMPLTLTHGVAFQNHRDWIVSDDDADWVDSGPGSTFRLMNRGEIQADPDGQH